MPSQFRLRAESSNAYTYLLHVLQLVQHPTPTIVLLSWSKIRGGQSSRAFLPLRSCGKPNGARAQRYANQDEYHQNRVVSWGSLDSQFSVCRQSSVPVHLCGVTSTYISGVRERSVADNQCRKNSLAELALLRGLQGSVPSSDRSAMWERADQPSPHLCSGARTSD